MFQSLFFWNSRPDSARHDREDGEDLFQSLFFWNSRPDGNGARTSRFACRVSILVFLELAPGLDPALRAIPFSDGVSILVFLELAPGLWGGCISQRSAPSFNPCFSGTRARTISGGGEGVGHILFQSLFFWNSRPDDLSPRRYRRIGWFQSLFFWNSRPDFSTSSPTRRPSTSFNPCFSGTRART